MPEKKCVLDTGTVGILEESVVDGQISLPQADDSLHRMIKAGFYSPIRSLADIQAIKD